MIISVIICTYNPRKDYLDRTLSALKKQTLSKSEWELLLIDNASEEPISQKIDLAWHPNSLHLNEKIPGKINAIIKGIKNSRGKIILIVDDDNILDDDYLNQCLIIYEKYNFIGVWGGSIKGEFEVKPNKNILPYLPGLAVSEINRDFWSNLPEWSFATPYGAGMCLRIEVAQAYLSYVINDPIRKLLGRSGSKLSAGEDTDMALAAVDMGMGVGRFSSLKMTHLIPEERLNEKYIIKLYSGFSESSIILSVLRGERKIKSIKNGYIKKYIFFIYKLFSSSSIQRKILIASRKAEIECIRMLNDLL